MPPNRSIGLLRHGVGGVLIGDVDPHAQCLVAVGGELGRRLLGLLAVEIGENDRRARVGERASVDLADPARAARDDRDLVLPARTARKRS